MKRPPPEPFTLQVITCPACGHGIDPHGLNPGGKCGVGESLGPGVRGIRACDCRWSPNDIAAQRWADLREQIEALHTVHPADIWDTLDALAGDLREMDRAGAIHLDQWPAAARLVAWAKETP